MRPTQSGGTRRHCAGRLRERTAGARADLHVVIGIDLFKALYRAKHAGRDRLVDAARGDATASAQSHPAAIAAS